MRYFFANGRLNTRPLPVATEAEAAGHANRSTRLLPAARFEVHAAQPFARKKRKTLSIATRSEAAQIFTHTAPAGGNFRGDPGAGNFNVGIALGPNGNSSITAARSKYAAAWPGDSKVSVIHNYSNNANGVSASMLDEAINAGFIPSQSFKMPNFSTTQILAGSADAAITTAANTCMARAPWPIWLCYWHEPEDDFNAGTAANNYRAAFRYIALRFRAEGVTNVAFQPIYMNPFTFSSGSGRDWRNWHADWTGSTWFDDITMDMFGVDTYCPLPWSLSAAYPAGPWYSAARNFYTFAELWASLQSKVELPGYPVWDYTQMEFGMSNAFTTDPNWQTWGVAARDFAKANRIKNFTYWDNSSDFGRWSFFPYSGSPNPDANGTKILGWQTLFNASIKKVTP